MCYGDDARPPLPPVAGAAADEGDLELEAGDGNRFAAHFARAAEPTGAGMLILPDVRGLHEFYKDLASRFAEAGIDAVAIDYFGRTARIGARDEKFDYWPHVEKTTPQAIDADAAAGIAFLRSQDGGAVGSVFSVGFCFGGGNSWRQSATNAVAGAIGFYGRPARVREYIPRMKAPLLLLVAGADHATPEEEFHRFDRELSEAGVAHEMKVYPGAPHSFFDRTFSQHRDACDDAWRRMLNFVQKNSS
jgi:carboxymethylenebutenolidase